MNGKRMTLFAVGTALLIAVIVFAGFLLLGRGETEPIALPEVPGDSQMYPGGEENQANVVISAQITPHTVQAVVETLKRPAGYHRTLETQLFWSGGSGQSRAEIWQSGSTVRLDVTENGESKHLILTEDALYIWYNDGEGVYQTPLPESRAALAEIADALSSVPGYEKLLGLEEAQILEAKLSELDGKSCIYVRAETGGMGYTEEYYIDNETGLLMAAAAYDGEQLVYEMKSGAVELTAPDDSYFCLPGETVPLIS